MDKVLSFEKVSSEESPLTLRGTTKDEQAEGFLYVTHIERGIAVCIFIHVRSLFMYPFFGFT